MDPNRGPLPVDQLTGRQGLVDNVRNVPRDSFADAVR
jgi:hypothetical protein